jgi:hypothetical protein
MEPKPGLNLSENKKNRVPSLYVRSRKFAGSIPDCVIEIPC